MSGRFVLCSVVIFGVLAACSPEPLTETSRTTVTIASLDFPGALWDPLMPAPGDGDPVSIEARLTIPPTEDAVPVVIIAPGCGGVSDAELGWVSFLERSGVGSLLIDHFGRRGVTNICFGGETVNTASMLVDVYRAVDALEGNPHVDTNRVAVMGLSFGGRTALWSAMTRFRDRYEGPTFLGHIALYPSTCFIRLEDEHLVTGAPIRIYHGTADDWTPIGQCEDLVERMTGRGVDIDLVAYQDAHHSFDNSSGPTPAVLIPAISPRKCSFLEQDGDIVDTDTGQIVGVHSTCVEVGAHYGFDSAARDRARADVVAFLAEVFGG